MTKTQNDECYSEKLHRSIGTVLEPLFTWQGMDVYPVFGAEGDDDTGGEGGDSEPGDDDDDDDTGSGSTDDASGDGVSREDFEKLKKQLQAADKRAGEAEKRIKAIDDGKKDELTKATERVQELEKAAEVRDKELGDLRLQNAFLTATTGITWHDPADALDIAERRGYLEGVVGEDGKVDVKKLGTKLKELAKAKPNLVKNTSEEEDKGKNQRPPASGAPVGSKGSNQKQGGDEIPSRYAKHLR